MTAIQFRKVALACPSEEHRGLQASLKVSIEDKTLYSEAFYVIKMVVANV